MDKVRHSNAEEPADVKAEKAKVAHRRLSGFHGEFAQSRAIILRTRASAGTSAFTVNGSGGRYALRAAFGDDDNQAAQHILTLLARLPQRNRHSSRRRSYFWKPLLVLVDFEQCGRVLSTELGTRANQRACMQVWYPAKHKRSDFRLRRTAKIIRQLRNPGYRIEPPNPQPSQAQAE